MNKNILIMMICFFHILPILGMKRPGDDMASSEQKKKRNPEYCLHGLLVTESFKDLFKKLSNPTCDVNEKNTNGVPFIKSVLDKIKAEQKERLDSVNNTDFIYESFIIPRKVKHLQEQTQTIQTLQGIGLQVTQHPSFERDTTIQGKHILNFLADKYVAEEDLEYKGKLLSDNVELIKNLVEGSIRDQNSEWLEQYPQEMQTQDFQRRLLRTDFAGANKEQVEEVINGFKREIELENLLNKNIIDTCDNKNPIQNDRSPLHRIALRTSHEFSLNVEENEEAKYLYNQRALNFASLLLLNGANPNLTTPTSNSTPLHYCSASAFVDKPMAYILIQHGACVNAINNRGECFRSPINAVSADDLINETKKQTIRDSHVLAFTDYHRNANLSTLLQQRETGQKRFFPAQTLMSLNLLQVNAATNFALTYEELEG